MDNQRFSFLFVCLYHSKRTKSSSSCSTFNISGYSLPFGICSLFCWWSCEYHNACIQSTIRQYMVCFFNFILKDSSVPNAIHTTILYIYTQPYHILPQVTSNNQHAGIEVRGSGLQNNKHALFFKLFVSVYGPCLSWCGTWSLSNRLNGTSRIMYASDIQIESVTRMTTHAFCWHEMLHSTSNDVNQPDKWPNNSSFFA